LLPDVWISGLIVTVSLRPKNDQLLHQPAPVDAVSLLVFVGGFTGRRRSLVLEGRWSLL